MNNRIQELAEQAGLLGPSSRVGKAHEATEKFAELIIAECAKACEPRPWVGLTAQEAADCWTTSATKTWHNFEAALRSKNHD